MADFFPAEIVHVLELHELCKQRLSIGIVAQEECFDRSLGRWGKRGHEFLQDSCTADFKGALRIEKTAGVYVHLATHMKQSSRSNGNSERRNRVKVKSSLQIAFLSPTSRCWFDGTFPCIVMG